MEDHTKTCVDCGDRHDCHKRWCGKVNGMHLWVGNECIYGCMTRKSDVIRERES